MNINKCIKAMKLICTMDSLGLDLTKDYPTDRGHFDEKNIIHADLKRSIVLYSPCRPTKTEFPTSPDGSGYLRKFSSEFYFKTVRSGVRIPRLWLCYSLVLDCVYCETCWLFASRLEKFKNNWIMGINDWHHIGEKISVHEISKQHIQAVEFRNIWSQNKTIDSQLETQINKEALFWKNVLTRLIKIILFLTAGNTGLRGNEGSTKQHLSEGNFMRTVKLLADFDPILSKLLNDEKYKIKYLSWQIQNEIIQLLSTEVCKIIVNEVKTSKFYSLIVDSTQDITKIDQLSVILRYVVVNYDQKSIKIVESFLGFFELKKHGAIDHKNLIYEVLESYNLDIQNCRGQGYDGAAVMSGVWSGVQQRISSTVSNALYVHCCAHNLNLVICDAAKSSHVASNFFTTIQSIFNFFSSSAPRWSNLAFNTEFGHKIRQKVLKKVCPTRWEAKHESVSALKERYVDVLKSLTLYSLTSKKAEERCITASLKKKMESFEFVLMLGLWERVLRPLHGTSKTLQKNDIDLQAARNRLNDSFSSIQNLRDDYTNIVKYAKEMCKKWGVPLDMAKTRQRLATKYFDEVDVDRRLNITESNFKIKIFLPLIDTVLNQLRMRFESLKEVCDVFEFLKPELIIKSEESKTIKSCYDFILLYKSDVGSELVSQILSLKEIIVNKNLKSIRDLATFIVQNDFSTSYSEVLAACILFLTLPVTVATAERSFSKLKLIKNYLRNSMGQTRLSNIAVLNIEQHRTAELSLDNIILQFSNLKARRMKF